VGSEVEEVVKWDRDLRLSKTFQTLVLILSGRKFKSPNLESLQKIMFLFMDKPACNYFKRRLPQATAFQNIQAACKAGWKTKASHNKKWSKHFVVEQLALLLVLWKQVKKKNGAQGLYQSIFLVFFIVYRGARGH
jgi:hypothetical protein